MFNGYLIDHRGSKQNTILKEFLFVCYIVFIQILIWKLSFYHYKLLNTLESLDS